MLNGNPVFALLANQFIHLQFNNQQFYLSGATVVDREEVPSVPLPAAFPLLASGLGAAGVLGWRRKRKAAASAA